MALRRRKSKAADPEAADSGAADPEAADSGAADPEAADPEAAESGHPLGEPAALDPALPDDLGPADDLAPADELASADELAPAHDAPAWPSTGIDERAGGPWDAVEVGEEDKIERIDLGGVRVPIVRGMELRAEIAEDQVVAVTLIVGRSALQIQPFAAPRTIGLWEEIRAEIAAGIGESGGRATESGGRFGPELVAEVAVTAPEGTTGVQTARFLGVNGPRWFLRAVITGEGATDDAARGELEDLLADVVVVRGADAMAPRDPIPLRLPEEVEVGTPGEAFDADPGEDADSPVGRSEDDLKPFERGPEITEIR